MGDPRVGISHTVPVPAYTVPIMILVQCYMKPAVSVVPAVFLSISKLIDIKMCANHDMYDLHMFLFPKKLNIPNKKIKCESATSENTKIGLD